MAPTRVARVQLCPAVMEMGEPALETRSGPGVSCPAGFQELLAPRMPHDDAATAASSKFWDWTNTTGQTQ